SFVAFLGPGDEGGDPTESKRLINAARKRVQSVLGIKSGDGIDADALLAWPLPDKAQEIFSAGSSQAQYFASAREMQKHLTRLIRGDGSLWPLVKQVSIRGPYECLRGGLELVDLPGLNDSNEARVEVTREFLRTSPFVWLMFPMVRGLTEEIKEILHDEK